MILVVDDEPGVLRLCQRLLERAGYTVRSASNSNQALGILSQEVIDLLLADIRLPGVSGFKLLDTIRQKYPEMSVVMMTGYGTVDVAIEALHRGADGLILKPFEGAELVRTIQAALLDRQRGTDSLRLKILRPLFDISEAFYSETKPNLLTGLILETVLKHLDSRYAGIYEERDGHSSLDISELDGNSIDNLICQTLQELAAQSSRQGEALQIDLMSNPINLPDHLVEPLRAYKLQYLLFAPRIKNNNAFVLIASRSENEAAFLEGDRELLGNLAQQAAAALDNARLYGELRSSLNKLEKSQNALLRAEKIATAGRLTASIAHEINNPLQSLSNCLDLAGRNELAIEVREKYLKVAQAELDRLMMTVQRMLNLFRPGAKERQWTRLDQVVEHVLTLLDAQMKRSNINIISEIPSPAPVILAVTDQIQQVLLNLLINSIEAMPGGGSVTIKMKESRGNVEIRIEDTGHGIQMDDPTRIFEPFISSKEYGTGLGLAVSYGIVQAHGGTLELESGEGEGARFLILLPKGGNNDVQDIAGG